MRRRDDRIDGLRGVAALVAVLAGIPLIQAGEPERGLLQAGLALCYVVTGFLLYRPFVLALVRGDRRVDLRAYARDRLLRLLAPFLLAAGAAAALHVDVTPDLVVFAALPVFCVLLPACWGLARLLGRGEAHVRAAVVPGVLLAVLGVAGILVHDALTQATAFGLGMLAAVADAAVRGRRTLRSTVQAVRRAAILFLVAGLAALPAFVQLRVPAPAVALVGSGALVVVSLPGRTVRGLLSGLLGSVPLRYAGRLSYGLFLWHYPVAVAVRDHVQAGGATPAATAFAVTWLAAEVSRRLVEIPLQRSHRPWLLRVDAPLLVLPEPRPPELLVEPIVVTPPPLLGRHRADLPQGQETSPST